MNNDKTTISDEELYNQINEKTNYMLSDEETEMIFKLIRDFQNDGDKKREKQEN